ncbi:uncharacterized protein MYCFIDRAFT_175757 [Pseudocercospora fijiensis CIRAD86]|uniref:Uncharacterized protein n=1 Tax=Pseudocercospora fijiensis (strain CIRAD86) TaxID=383855 RepID=M3AXN5_PSEFD|nr:uncharacterized protein MYCFIDRAFT_175757 [Pseudocercospora fijiensis CIRAD86]EME82222.1 hypothetical protein MYCFIDRAFT_175757 [Pseudocercospora fijiensis CIRAD86]
MAKRWILAGVAAIKKPPLSLPRPAALKVDKGGEVMDCYMDFLSSGQLSGASFNLLIFHQGVCLIADVSTGACFVQLFEVLPWWCRREAEVASRGMMYSSEANTELLPNPQKAERAYGHVRRPTQGCAIPVQAVMRFRADSLDCSRLLASHSFGFLRDCLHHSG